MNATSNLSQNFQNLRYIRGFRTLLAGVKAEIFQQTSRNTTHIRLIDTAIAFVKRREKGLTKTNSRGLVREKQLEANVKERNSQRFSLVKIPRNVA